MVLRKDVALLLSLAAVTLPSAHAQTYRGGIAGAVQDSSGAIVPHASITITNKEAGFTRTSNSTNSGDYSFQDLPLGVYSVIVEAPGFAKTQVDNITIRAGQVFAQEIRLGVATSSETVEVNAAAISLDAVSSTNNSVVNQQAVANIPLNGRDFIQLIKIVPGYNGAGSINGARTNQNNYQIDGADNNDIWQNGAAANQAGVNGIAGVTLPIDAIDQFNVQNNGNAEAGRNAGSLISLAIKTGTNHLHGSGYYFNRNEFFASQNPFITTAKKAKLRNSQFGGSLGGPIQRDKLFFFVNYERQKFVIANTAAATEPTTAYVQAGTALLAKHGIPVNPLSLSLLSLWPQGNKPAGPATTSNYFDGRPQTGYADNAIGNLNYNLTPRQTLRVQAFIGTGRQTAPVGSNVFDYYQTAPDITQNFSVSHNWAVNDRISNQLIAAVGVFNQTFNDANHSFNVPSLGLNTGVTNPSLFGAPTITLTNFDQTGVTQPLGRKDYTGHITEVATLIKGRHQYRVGGEYRRNYMDLQYQRNVRGTFSFNGTATSNANIRALLPAGATRYDTDTTVGSDIRVMADYLAGYVASSSFTQGYLRRGIYQNTFAAFAQDQFQASPTFTLNYGLRYEYNAPITSNGQMSVYRPGTTGVDGFGLVLAGSPGARTTVYPGNHTNLSPRFGFSYQAADRFVLRGTYGLFYDAPNFNGFFDNRPGNGGAVGVQANNTGPTPVFNVSPTFYQWQTGVAVFPTAASPTQIYGLATVSPRFHTAYVQNFGVNTQYQVNRNTIATVAYVGSIGRRLFNLSDINQARPGTGNSAAAELTRRPIYVNKSVPNYANIGAVNEIQSEGTSSYHSLQGTLRTSGFHGLTAQGSYTYGHALDVISGTRGLAPQDSLNLAGDYASADFDVRHTFNGYVVYEVPQFSSHLTALTRGWEGNAFITAFTGTPFSVKVGSDISGTGENQDRVNAISGVNPHTTTGQTLQHPATGAPYAQLYTAAAFTNPGTGSFGTTSRNLLRGPGFFTTDASLIKNTLIREGINLQIRAETFNIFNRTNLANPTGTLSSASFGRSTNTRNAGSATGIGPGEPFNVQFAGKIIF